MFHCLSTGFEATVTQLFLQIQHYQTLFFSISITRAPPFPWYHYNSLRALALVQATFNEVVVGATSLATGSPPFST